MPEFEHIAEWMGRFSRAFARPFAICMAVIGISGAMIYLSPAALGFFAPPLDPSLDLYAVNRPAAFTFLDAKGNVIGHRGAEVGTRLRLDQMPPYLPAAFVAMEDRHFYSHNGIDLKGLARAAYADWRAGKYVAGGSTISQQTAKIVYGDRTRTLGRKVSELLNTESLERGLSKKQILEIYLNRLYLGAGAYGVDGAAHAYFGISARQVTLAQAAMLAALTRAPSVFSPRRDLAAAQLRARRVLTVMVQTGAITPAQAQAAKAEAVTVTVITHADSGPSNYFLDAAADQARDLLRSNSDATGDLIIHTTLEPTVQDAAQAEAVAAIQKFGAKLNLSQAAIVVMKPDGALSALVGGVDYQASVFNRATQAHRQPGSAFKPFVYMAALEAGISPWDMRDDQPVDIAGYQPANYNKAVYGRMRLTDALAHSVNTITVNLAQEVGVANVSAAARRVGITSPLQDNASLALGTNEVTPLELTAAYAVFANGGNAVTPYLVTRVEDAATGVTLYDRDAAGAGPVIGQTVDRDLTAMLYNVVTSGTGTGARLGGREAAGKTGTTQDYRDAWFVGFTSDYVAGVWVGNDDNAAMRGVTGGTVPALIWKNVMTAAEQDYPAKALDRSQAPEPEAEDPADLAVQAVFTDYNDPSAAFRQTALHDDSSAVLGSGLAVRRVARADAQMPDAQMDQPQSDWRAAEQPVDQAANAQLAQQRMAYGAPPPGYAWVEPSGGATSPP